MTAAPAPASRPAPPEHAGESCHNVTLAHDYPMRTQPGLLRVVYMVAPDVLACAALSDAHRALVRAGAGLAVGLSVAAAAVAAGPVGDGGEDAAIVAAVSAHSRSLG